MTDETAPHSNRPVLRFDAILAEEHPEIMAAAKSVRDELGLYFATYSDSRKADARLTALLLQALNDIADLLDEVVHLKGRPALRTARALVEHLPNLAHASSTPEEATRFAEHAVVAALLEAELKIGAGQLSSKDRRSYVDRMERLEQEARPYYDKAIAKYGWKFRTSWTSLNAANRADQYGHSDLYGFYRLASKVVHGSAGGTLGLFDREVPATGGPVVMRIGPSAEAAVLAFHQGFEAALRFVTTFDTWLDRQQPSRLATKLEALLGHWSKIQGARPGG